ncbi:hypothetical protein K491DRAFT_588191 [Lophiostoma macrostomum CBS 122681]|uniref:Uncharacterized protein n=1 Tax=Lophiostoma macrostomum CBS 122681 TaxID=1314788 RepID=A0A6A6TR36_9PLEO|nr:hypothetical protein K491DRAFT_588191 [Lophiostoma macrostomum CBS 122681]
MGFHSYHIFFNVQTSSVHLDDWISLLTLCLAPLLVHIIVGVPHPTYLNDKPPKWHDRIVHYNPTSIVWRYFVIADRRLRSKDWTGLDMAASNALFWTADGWDGSEAMMVRSRMYCEKQPQRTTVQLFSVSTGKTVVITAQGIQALALIITGITKFSRFFIKIGMPNIFFPFTVLGLVRLCAAMWLTDEYVYLQKYHMDSDAHPEKSNDDITALPTVNSQFAGLASAKFHPKRGRYGLPWRIFFLLFIACLWLLPTVAMLPFRWGIYFTGTLFCMGIFYFTFLSVTLFSIAACIFREKSGSTIFPYSGTMWYKIYTCLLFTMMLGMLIVAGLENRKSPCGKFTSYPPKITSPSHFDFDGFLCNGWGGE